MSNYPAGASEDSKAPYNEMREKECHECGKIIDADLDDNYCSDKCHKSSMR